MLDVVLSVHILSIAPFFLEPSYHGVFSGHSLQSMLGIGTQITLKAMTLKVFMDTRCGKVLSLLIYLSVVDDELFLYSFLYLESYLNLQMSQQIIW